MSLSEVRLVPVPFEEKVVLQRLLERNGLAQAFWRKVIGDYTGGDYTEERDEGDGDVVERFVSR